MGIGCLIVFGDAQQMLLASLRRLKPQASSFLVSGWKAAVEHQDLRGYLSLR